MEGLWAAASALAIGWAFSTAYWTSVTWHVVRRWDQGRFAVMALAVALGPVGYVAGRRGSGSIAEGVGIAIGIEPDTGPTDDEIDWSSL